MEINFSFFWVCSIPLAIALNGLQPLKKVWVDYLPYPKKSFVIRVNDADIYSLVKEEADFDPT